VSRIRNQREPEPNRLRLPKSRLIYSDHKGVGWGGVRWGEKREVRVGGWCGSPHESREFIPPKGGCRRTKVVGNFTSDPNLMLSLGGESPD